MVAVEAARRRAEVLATDFAPGMAEVMRRRQLPDWTPPLRPLFTSLSAEATDRAATAFGEVVREHSTGEGMPQAALIGIGAR